MKKILFISSVNLTINPRIYKEILLAVEKGYQITFLGFKMGNWSDEKEIKINQAFPGINFIYLDATRKDYFTWLFYSLHSKMAQLIWPFFKTSLQLDAFALSKRTLPILNILKKDKETYDIIIAHTLAALYPAYFLAKKSKSKFAFDLEDYHPGEKIFSDEKNEISRREQILKRTLPEAVYLTAASPLIAEKVEDLIPGINIKSVLNVFPAKEFIMPQHVTSPKLQLVWFSQNINFGRGLELICDKWDILFKYFDLTLIGLMDLGFYNAYLINNESITVLPPLKQEALHNRLSSFDVGLALEIDTVDLNKSLALSNKILAYYQAGLYILATNTLAQKDFVYAHQGHGAIAEKSADSIVSKLMEIYNDRDLIRKNNRQRFNEASTKSWEIESDIIYKEWQKAIG